MNACTYELCALLELRNHAQKENVSHKGHGRGCLMASSRQYYFSVGSFGRGLLSRESQFALYCPLTRKNESREGKTQPNRHVVLVACSGLVRSGIVYSPVWVANNSISTASQTTCRSVIHKASNSIIYIHHNNTTIQ